MFWPLALALAMPAGQRSGSVAVAYLACDDATMWIICNAVNNLRTTGYADDIVVITPVDLKVTCASHSVITHKVQAVAYPSHMKRRANGAHHRYCRYTKLQLWNLDYERVVYLDYDTFVLDTINFLVRDIDVIPGTVAAARDTVGPVFNSGVMVLRPNQITYAKLFELSLTHISYNNGDQGLLNAFFMPDKVQWLDYSYNVPAQLMQSSYWRKNKVRIVHYTGESKPWNWHENTQKSAWKPAADDLSMNLWYRGLRGAKHHKACSSFKFKRRTGVTCVIVTFSRATRIVQQVIDSVMATKSVTSIRIKNLNPDRRLSRNDFYSHVPLAVDSYDTDSLNHRFDVTGIETTGVLYLDDDIVMRPVDLTHMLSVWDDHQDLLVGTFNRAHSDDYRYTTSTNQFYSMILTKAMVVSIDYVYKYYCLLPPQVLDYVTRGTNCEDILMNYVVASVKGAPPLFVASVDVRDYGRTNGLSLSGPKAGWSSKRTACTRHFRTVFGDLYKSTTYIQSNWRSKTTIATV